MVDVLQEHDMYKSGQFKFDSVFNWNQCSCLSRGSDGEKRGALSTTLARQFCTRCNLERSCLAILFISELQ